MLDSGPNFNGATMRVLPHLLSLVCVLLALTACGKKGDLYLPDAPAHPQQTQPAK
jgi:predicted small lipoprotein YifL